MTAESVEDDLFLYEGDFRSTCFYLVPTGDLLCRDYSKIELRTED